ncbi:MAG: ABC transporter ATP-binding protein [Armatimonadota bacterium]|nr:ABC transporter ATP-binding protein [bacterium]MCS7309766.1 ABC transporter ATP-binding protein [Armatimonadota bacterium]MDW8104026.1 ABC transporter ATP-binding protein [Armatimonadota bacterium]MDW8290067.1 ABC transporter ATP-binding protein [Armatimonadota bacterium]
MKEPAIVLEHVSKTYRLSHQPYSSLKGILLSMFRYRRRIELHQALRDVNLTIWRGETVGLIGVNGSGKSTLLAIIARVIRPSAGTVHVNGRVAPLLQLGVGFHPDLTGLENVYFNGIILGLTRQQVAERLPAIVRFAELEEFIDTPIRAYSSGMVLRLGFAVAVHTDPEIILMDEVLAVGDEAFQHKCLRKIQEFQKEGRTILLVSHDMNQVRQVATRVVWLHQGQVMADGPTEEVVSEYLAFAEQREREIS